MFWKKFEKLQNKENAFVLGRAGKGKTFYNVRYIHDDDIVWPYVKEGKIQELEEKIDYINNNRLHLSCVHENVLKDIQKIKGKIEEYHIEQPCLKHCCDPDGLGYWVLWDKNIPKQRHYFSSSIELAIYGAAASEFNTIRLYLYGLYLYDFLSFIKQECNVEMEIKYLYFPYVFSCLEGFKNNHEFFQTLDAERMLDDLIQKYGDFRNMNGLEYYNGEDAVYYAVNQNIKECIEAINCNRDVLEQNGLWNDAKNVIRQLHNIKFREMVGKEERKAGNE